MTPPHLQLSSGVITNPCSSRQTRAPIVFNQPVSDDSLKFLDLVCNMKTDKIRTEVIF